MTNRQAIGDVQPYSSQEDGGRKGASSNCFLLDKWVPVPGHLASFLNSAVRGVMFGVAQATFWHEGAQRMALVPIQSLISLTPQSMSAAAHLQTSHAL